MINKTASSKNVPAWSGATTNISCVADGNPAPRFIWTNSSGVVATSEESGLLQVTPQGGNGFGPYTCTVENNRGKDSLDIQLVKVGMFKDILYKKNLFWTATLFVPQHYTVYKCICNSFAAQFDLSFSNTTVNIYNDCLTTMFEVVKIHLFPQFKWMVRDLYWFICCGYGLNVICL